MAAAADVDLSQYGELDMVRLTNKLCPPEPPEQRGMAEQTDRVRW